MAGPHPKIFDPSMLPFRFFRFSVVMLLLLTAHAALAQRPAHYEHPRAELDKAYELFDKSKYGAAQHEADRIAQSTRDLNAPQRIEAEYIGAISAVRLFNKDAANRLLQFMEDHPEDLHVGAVRYELFRHYFTNKRWRESILWAKQIDPEELSDADREEFYFKKGYAHFQEDQAENALNEFARLKDGTGPYAIPSTYFTAHIDYDRGRYASAMVGFEKLKDDPSFGRIVPFYVAEIHFLQGRYDEVIAYVEPLLNDPKGTRRIGELNRLVGESHFRSGRFAASLPFLEKSVQRSVGISREERYQLGYAYYKADQCQKALTQFSLITNEEDSLAQLAVYHMADCYLHLQEKNYARNAFKRAYELGHDAKVTEDALFNYAKLAYELSFDPYHEAIAALQGYLKAYPNTPRRDEAYGFLVDVFLKTRNYEAALEALDAIPNKGPALREAYEKLAFDRGVELYEGRRYDDAVKAFKRALTHPVVPSLNARCHYWMGESYYAMEQYQQALKKYDDLRNSPGAYAGTLYAQASYSMGYAYFKMKRYNEALTALRRFVGTSGVDADQRADAMLRVADCYYLAKDQPAAIRWYDEAMQAGTKDADYAMFQKAVVLGLELKFGEKITVLKKLLAERPNSRFAADAKFQLGETYINMEKDVEAMDYYAQVVTGHPNSPHVRQSMLQRALIHKRQGDAERALAEFKTIVAQYPTMDGARDALAGIESIYIEQGRVAEYEAYLRSLTFVDPNNLDLDEKYYRSAEALYFDEKCEAAIGAFGDYLAKYPNGAFAVNALFYRGDCRYRLKQFAEALPDLEAVIQKNATQFMESALFGASDILFKDGRWEGALVHFRKLEEVASFPQNVLAAKVGQMRCLRELNRTGEAAKAAESVLGEADASRDIKAEAGLVIARASLDANELDVAYTLFKKVATSSTNANGAEAKYNMAYVRHLQERWTDAEKEVFELVKAFPTYDHWKAKSFILLGDVYVRMDDRFQAKATFQSVIDHSTDPELVAQARQRLNAILASEVEATSPAEQEEIMVPMGDGENGPDE